MQWLMPKSTEKGWRKSSHKKLNLPPFYMPITPENLPKHELIGLEAEVVESTDKQQIGISGEVMDEKQSMLRIGEKEVEKKNCVFIFELPDGQKVKLDGKLIDKRPEERAGMKLPEKWEYLD